MKKAIGAVYWVYMISKYNHKDLNWIDLESGTKEEINHIMEEYSIPSNIQEKLNGNDKEDRFEMNYDYIYASINNRITFIVSDRFLISIHSDPILAFTTSSKELELDMVSIEKINNNKVLFAHLLKNLFKNRETEISSYFNQVEKLKNKISTKNKIIKKRNVIIIILIIVSIIAIWL